MIGKRRVKEGLIGANLGPRWGHVGLKIEEDRGQKITWKKGRKKEAY